MKIKNIIASALLLIVVNPCQAAYVEPTRRIALNEVIALSAQAQTYPLYLRYAGRYYAELYLVNDEGEIDHSYQQPLRLNVQIDFARKGRLLHSEFQEVEFTPGRPNQTVFWTRAPLDLPQRKNLDVTVKLNPLTTQALGAPQNVRLQITRKFEFTPIYR